ncbi:DNA cytosine methyltransferase [Labrys sp. KB_33_2]
MALHPRRLDFISLCSGGGGLDLGLELACRGARPVCLVEREAFAVAHLVEAMRQGLMAPAPVWSDARTFRGREWRGLVDGVIGGIPCQPHSLAGKRLGEEDERDLWSTARRIIVQSGAWFALIENVGGMLSSGGAERVWRDLRRLGFAVEAGLFTAAEVGASHQRERLFLLAVAGNEVWRRGDEIAPATRHANRWADRDGGGELVDASCVRCREGRTEPGFHIGRYAFASASGSVGNATLGNGEGLGRSKTHHASAGFGEYRGPSAALADADVVELRQQSPAGQQSLLQQDDGIGLFPPGPGDLDGWREVLARAPELEPSLRRVADGLASGLDDARIERLRMLGNGVVPLEAAYAVRTLAARLAASGASAATFLLDMTEAVE